ncbi:diguanylate cyclase domain-containing protein [uncultured Ilyobacter sp.]|uniref:GGDEF domain-containing protein n=1 Tax=uncultured Ilyobacter sp. TaxID=544433 RepID=UPI0029F55EB1|nr:diguanylate cyclase [uncultured Ilyobacter sp.]
MRLKKENGKGRPISICLMDIPNLAHINNKLGITGGDKLIKTVGNILSSNFRKTDPFREIQ